MDNQRRHERSDVTIPVKLTIAGEQTDSQLENLSIGGAQIALARLDIGTELTMTFEYGETGLTLPGIVRWSSDAGSGIQFDGLRARDVWDLQHVIKNFHGADAE